MRKITVYEADDGSRWDDETAALERDALIAECDGFKSHLGIKPRPDSTDFSNGGGYITQPPGARDSLMEFLKAKGANRDSEGPIGRLMDLMHCIDHKGRQWGQAYYAINPTEGKQKPWGKVG